MNPLILDPQGTALIVVDLQDGVPFDYRPHPYPRVVANAVSPATEFARVGAFIVCLKVPTSARGGALHPVTDAPSNSPQLAEMARQRAKISEKLVPGLDGIANKHVIERQQWGGFYGTDLDAQLRRRNISTIVLCGVATGFGVDTTAREAYQHNYQQIFAEDAMGSLSEEEQAYVCTNIFPRMGKLRSTKEILNAFADIAPNAM